MAETATDLWGQDIALDTSAGGLGQAIVSAAGELALTDGVQTGVQDIRYRYFTRLGTLFYDGNFGSLIHDWIVEENTAENRMGLEAELIMRAEMDPRVAVGSVSARTLAWDETGLTVETRWTFIGEDQPLNLVLQYNKSTKELVIADAAPTGTALDARIQDA
jgi:hypothetical protein